MRQISKINCISKEKSLNMENSVKNLTKVIIDKYISSWSISLHNGKTDLKMEIQDGLEQILLDLGAKMEKMDLKMVLMDFVSILQLQLRQKRLDSGKMDRMENSIKVKKLELAFEKLMMSLNIHDYLASEMVFDTVNKIIVKQVLIKKIKLR